MNNALACAMEAIDTAIETIENINSEKSTQMKPNAIKKAPRFTYELLTKEEQIICDKATD